MTDSATTTRTRIARVRAALSGAPSGPDRVEAARDFEALVRKWERSEDDTRETKLEEER